MHLDSRTACDWRISVFILAGFTDKPAVAISTPKETGRASHNPLSTRIRRRRETAQEEEFRHVFPIPSPF
jgi:hypothetical protein